MDEIRLRFLHAMQFLSHEMAARLTQIDYDREMALVLCEPTAQKESALYGMVRITADPDNARAEFAILIHHDMTGMGLGPDAHAPHYRLRQEPGYRGDFRGSVGREQTHAKTLRGFRI